MAIDPIRIQLSVDVTDAAESVATFVRDTRQAMETQLSSSVDRAKAKIDELGRKFREVSGVIEENKRRIQELSAAKEKASGDDKRRIDQELTALKRITDGRQVELLKIEEKRTKLTELYLMTTAQTDAEREAINRVTSARLAEIGTIKDQTRALSAVTDEVSKGSGAIENYVKGFLGIGTAISLVRVLADSLELSRKEIEQTTEAAGKLRDKAFNESDRLRPFFQEFGLRTKAERDSGQKALADIAQQNDLDPQTVQGAAGDVAANLRDVGITEVSSGRGADLLRAAAVAKGNGLDTKNLTQLFQQNKGITGADLERQLSQVLAVTGSPSRANAFLEAYSSNRVRLQAGGMGTIEDALKLYKGIAAKVGNPNEAPEIFRQFSSALDKFAFGKTAEEKMGVAESLGMAGAGEAARIYMQPGPVDARAIFASINKLDATHRDMAARALGAGSRGGVALSAAGDIGSQTLPTGEGIRLLGPQTDAERTRAQIHLADTNLVVGNPPDDYAERIRADLANEQTRLLNHPEEMHAAANPNSFVGKYITPFRVFTGGSQEHNLARDASMNILKRKENEVYEAYLSAVKSGAPKEVTDRLYKNYTDIHSLYFGEDTQDVVDPTKAAPIFREADELQRKIAPPTTRPSTPTSINYHIRQTNYGSSYDSVGAPASLETRYS